MDRVYNLVIQEEITQFVVRSRAIIPNSMALAAPRSFKPTGASGVASSNGRKERRGSICDYCNVKGHDKASCFKLIGYPDWYPRSRPGAAASRSSA
jgi:hypothetical protein